jgi:SET domain-containing protein
VWCPPLMRIIICSVRHIEKGEQLLYNYGPRYWNKKDAPRLF